LAAIALHVTGELEQFDSAELTQLAANRPTVQPHFAYASLVAARTAAPAQVTPLLRSALLVAPDALSDIIRLRLFQAEVSLAHFEAAHLAIAPVLDAHSYLRFAPNPQSSDVNDVSDNTADTAIPGVETSAAANPLDPFTVDAALPDEASHRAFLLALADVDQHCGDDAAASRDLDAALKMHSPAAQASQLKTRIHGLEVALNLAAENAQRRPVVQSSVVQTVVVRPRLSALPEVHR
jgi:hypothetical protein